MGQNYHQLIFTDHALERLRLRSLSKAQVEQVITQPDQTQAGKKAGTIKFLKTLHQRQIQVIASKLKTEDKWLVVSVWVRGEADPVPLMWQLITLPFKIIAKIARIILSYIKKIVTRFKKL